MTANAWRSLPLAPLAAALVLALALLLPFSGRAAAQGEGVWTPIPTTGAPSPRYAQAAVWTGKELLVWGGRTCVYPPSCTGVNTTGEGAAYNPATNSWRSISSVGAPSPRAYAAAIWTGQEMLIWGGLGDGYLGDGAAYNPATDTWRPLPSAGAPAPRYRPAAVWTGRELLIWGGSNPALGDLGNGAAYDPSTNTWSPLPAPGLPVPQYPSVAIWTGTRMLLWGCCQSRAGASFDPATSTWSSLPGAGGVAPEGLYVGAWTGTHVLIWGASGDTKLGQPLVGQGASFDPATGGWSALPTSDAPSPRFSPEGVWTGTELLVWGGFGDGYTLPQAGAAYDPTTNSWRPLPTDGAPTGRCEFTSVWTGAQLLIWGGNSICDGFGEHPLGDGAAYTPPAGPACRFVLGFAALRAAIPAVVGDCLDDEAHNPANGDGLQHTTNGLLVWRKADNATAFTDGYHTWINGPDRVQERLNTQRFAWEANPAGLPVVR